MGFFAAAAAVYLFRPDLPVLWSAAIVRALVYISVLLINEFVRRASKKQRPFDIALWAVALIVAPLTVVLQYHFNEIGVIVHHSFMVVLQVTVLGNLVSVYMRGPSRGLISMSAGIAVVLMANLSQAVSAGLLGVVMRPGLDDIVSSSIYLSNIVCVMLFSIGYWSYMVDVSKRAEIDARVAQNTAEQQRKVAESVADEMARLVQERNELIMINSRFETLNNVGVFNAAVIHELSQPIQTILTKIEYLCGQNDVSAELLRKSLQDIHRSATTTSEIIHSVRSLLVDTPAPASFVEASEVFLDIRPIVESQANSDRVRLTIACDRFDHGVGIIVNPVLLNRVILSLVSNSLAALGGGESKGKVKDLRLEIKITRQVSSDGDLMRIEVWDNGSRFSKDFDSTLKTLSRTGKSGGMGLGLIISRQVLAIWRGSISVSRRDGGTEVSCCIPLVRRDSERISPA